MMSALHSVKCITLHSVRLCCLSGLQGSRDEGLSEEAASVRVTMSGLVTCTNTENKTEIP